MSKMGQQIGMGHMGYVVSTHQPIDRIYREFHIFVY